MRSGCTSLRARSCEIVLPPGISFYTFQEVAYIVDVYHGKLEPADSLLDYALFISLFPHLIAGPIQRPSHLLPQVQSPRGFDSDKFFDGMHVDRQRAFPEVCDRRQLRAALRMPRFADNLGPPNLATCCSVRTRSPGRSTAISAATAISRAAARNCSASTSW